MTTIALLNNVIQDYGWGSKTDIPQLLGHEPTGAPQAELWMGAHPKAPSRVPSEGKTLLELIDAAPTELLGPTVARDADGRLPFLFKVLAAAEPLSIQAHPTREQAKAGFADEERSGIPITSPNRNYVDDNHKPEIICALTPFWALSGFRRTDEIGRLLLEFDVADLDRSGALARKDLASFYGEVMVLPDRTKRSAVETLITRARELRGRSWEADWILRSADVFPGDFGLLSILILNLIKLEPGQALYQDAGLLHAYLSGLGMELMANSDNVLRGGLTRKHVDISELLRVLEFKSVDPTPLLPRRSGAGEETYDTPSREFVLSRIVVRDGEIYRARGERSIEIWIATEGQGTIESLQGTVSFHQGDSFVVPAAAAPYTIKGTATLYKATVPN